MIKEITNPSRMEQIINSKNYITVLEAADILGISTNAIREYIHNHNILAWKDCVNGHRRILYIKKRSVELWPSKPKKNNVRFYDVTSDSDMTLIGSAYLTIDDAAEVLNVCKRSVYEWIKDDIFTEVVRVWKGPNKFYYMLNAVECREIYRHFHKNTVRKVDIKKS